MRQKGVLVLGALVLLGGCASSQDAAAVAAARAFSDAVSRSDGTAACAYLAPRTRDALEESAGTTCASAILEEVVRAPGPTPVEIEVFGTMARLTYGQDTLFLARFGAQWRVWAAVCTPGPSRELPYVCRVEGG